MNGGLKGEGLEDVIPDVFQRHKSKVDPVCDEVYPSIELGGGFFPRNIIQAFSEELFERLAAQSVMQADGVGRKSRI